MPDTQKIITPIHCPECLSKGVVTILGKNISCRGKIELMCKRCRKPVEVAI